MTDTAPLVKPDDSLTSWLKQRERHGLDGRDEMWNGVLHLNPPASMEHQRLEKWLLAVLSRPAEEVGLELLADTGLWAADDDYKVPDLVAASEGRCRDRGVETPAELVIEIRSPGDETLDKVGWYDQVGTGELLVLDRDTKAVRHWVCDPSWRERILAPDEWHELTSIAGVQVRGGDRGLAVSVRGDTSTFGH